MEQQIQAQTQSQQPQTNIDKPNQNDLTQQWRKCLAQDGRVYYQNDVTKQTQWTNPLDQLEARAMEQQIQTHIQSEHVQLVVSSKPPQTVQQTQSQQPQTNLDKAIAVHMAGVIEQMQAQSKQAQTKQSSQAQSGLAKVITAELLRFRALARCACICLFVVAIPAFVTVFIASAYNNDEYPCTNTKYLIDLDIYLYVAAGALLVVFIIFSLTKVIAILLLCCGNGEDNAFLKTKIFLNSGKCRVMMKVYPLFHFVWACFGIVIYGQMSEECRDESIANIILLWIVIQFISVCGVMCCCWACYNKKTGIVPTWAIELK